jgi:hypothetical protein
VTQPAQSNIGYTAGDYCCSRERIMAGLCTCARQRMDVPIAGSLVHAYGADTCAVSGWRVAECRCYVHRPDLYLRNDTAIRGWRWAP